MPFAIEKAMDGRGLSASRSISKMQAWVFALGETDAINWERYADYGRPILRQICERYGFSTAGLNK